MMIISIIICASLLALESYSFTRMFQSDLRDKMKKYPSNDVTDFTDLVLNHRKFVDKSLLIKDYLESEQTVVVTRPKNWGKTLNLNMLKIFLQVKFNKDGNPRLKNINRMLFTGGCFLTKNNKTRCLKPLKIAQQYPELIERHQGKYPVMEFSIVKKFRPDYASTKRILNKKIKRIFYKDFPFLQKYFSTNSTILKGCDVGKLKKYIDAGDDKANPEEGFRLLIDALAAHFKSPVYVFIDKYDRLLSRNKINNNSSDEHAHDSIQNEYFKQICTLIGNIYSDIFKDAKTIRGMLTGISIIPYRELSQDFDLGGIKEDTVWEPVFTEHYGFTEEEVDTLLSSSSLAVKSRDVKHWYKGYLIDGKIIYTPLSITQCLNEGEIDSYWIGTVIDIDSIENLIPDKIKDDICTLMYANTHITSRIPKKITHFIHEKQRREEMLTSLLIQGYFTSVRLSKNHYNISIPNHEIREFLFYQIISRWLEKRLDIDTSIWKDWFWAKTEFSKTLGNYKMEELEADLTDVLVWPSPIHNSTVKEVIEKFYENLMTLLLFPATEDFTLNREYMNEDDLTLFTLTPSTSNDEKQNAIIIGYTRDRNGTSLALISTDTVRRVYDSPYHRDMKSKTFVKKIYCVGIAFCREDAEIQFVVEDNPNYHPSERITENKS